MEMDPTVTILEREQLETGEDSAKLRLGAALATIPADQAVAFNLLELREMTLEDASSLTSVTGTTLAKRRDLAVVKLEKLLGVEDLLTLIRTKPVKPKRRTKKPPAEKKPPRINWKKRLADNLAARPAEERDAIARFRDAYEENRTGRLQSLKAVHREVMEGADNDSEQRGANLPASPDFVAVVGENWKNTPIHVSARPNARRVNAPEDRRSINAAANDFLRKHKISNTTVNTETVNADT